MAETAARRRALRRLISKGAVRSQAELVAGLEEQGFAVTQATVSRDLAAMGASKDGSRYVINSHTVDHRYLARTLSTYVELFASSGNLVVLRTPPGAAQVVAAALDGSDLEEVLGTVAGDDTVLVISLKADGGASLQRRLEKIGETL
ncbi:MAG TPA: arginine repressor [Acidimicrobiia bacterium]|nr:arginine repressor [Acidimicrobiia bacterium]